MQLGGGFAVGGGGVARMDRSEEWHLFSHLSHHKSPRATGKCQ